MREDTTAKGPVEDAIRGTNRVRGARRAERGITIRVTDDEYATISEHAMRAGYESIAAYLRAVAIAPRPVYDTDAARVAKPLAAISYRLARITDVLDRNELDAVRGFLAEMRGIVADALLPLRRSHDDEVRSAQ